MGARKKKYSNNKISTSAKYQTWPWKHAVQDVPFSEVVVVAVGDVRWSQKHNRLVNGGRWGCHNPKPTLDLPLSFPEPQAVKLHNFPLKAPVMSCSWNVTGWEIVFLFIHVQENKSYYNHVFSRVMVSFCGYKKPSASLKSNVMLSLVNLYSGAENLTSVIFLVQPKLVQRFSSFLHLAKHYSLFMSVGHPVDINRECILSNKPQQIHAVGINEVAEAQCVNSESQRS